MVKKIIIGLLAIGILGGIYGYFEYNKKHRDIGAEEASITIGAVDLFTQYSVDEVGANAKYLDKVIVVSGTVMEVAAEEGSEMLVLQASDDLFGVNVYFDQPQVIEGVKVGDEVKVKGHCTGGDEMGVVIAHSALVLNK